MIRFRVNHPGLGDINRNKSISIPGSKEVGVIIIRDLNKEEKASASMEY